MRPLSIIAIPCLVLLLGLSAYFLMPPSIGSHPTSPRGRSASNLREIGQAILLYSNDHNGKYPDTFQDILLNEDITSDVFVSPLRNETPAVGPTTQAVADQLIAGGHLSYVYLGRGLSTITANPDTIVAYELPIDSSSGGNVLFGDLHVEFEDATWMTKLIDRLKSGQLPVTIPAN